MDKGTNVPVKRAWGYRHVTVTGQLASFPERYAEDLKEELMRVAPVGDSNHVVWQVGELYFQFSDGHVYVGTGAVGPMGAQPGLGDWAPKLELPGGPLLKGGKHPEALNKRPCPEGTVGPLSADARYFLTGE